MDKYSIIMNEVGMIDDDLTQILEDNIDTITNFLNNAENKRSIMLIYTFITRLHLIKDGIIHLCQMDMYYPSRILYRSFLEHYLRTHYFYLKYLETKTDEIGNDYYIFADMLEVNNYGKSFEKIVEMINTKRKGWDTWDILQKEFPKYSNYSKKQIKDKTTQFNFNEIVSYLAKKFSNDKTLQTIIASSLSDYSELSSFIHGGPNAQRTITEMLEDDGKRYKSYIELCKGSINSTWTMVILVYMYFSKLDIRFTKIGDEISIKLKQMYEIGKSIK